MNPALATVALCLLIRTTSQNMYLRARMACAPGSISSRYDSTVTPDRLRCRFKPEQAMSSPPSMNDLSPPRDFVEQMRPQLVKYFRRKTGSAVEAEDLVQDVLMRALTHANWSSTAEARGYIFRMAVNRWRDWCRRRRTHGITVAWDDKTNEETETGVENPTERVLMMREELDQLDRALRDLNERTRTVLILVKLEKVRIASVAEMLGISVSAVNKHLARGLAHLALMRNRQDSP